MADVAQLVRASVCGTEGRRFKPGHPPHSISGYLDVRIISSTFVESKPPFNNQYIYNLRLLLISKY